MKATPVSVGPRPFFQVEFWIPKKRGGSWMQANALPAGHAYSRTWRKVKHGHSHKDKLYHSIAMRDAGYGRDRTTVCDAYCTWARLKGLTTVTTWRGDHVSNKAATLAGLDRREVDDEPVVDEYDCYGDWDHDGHPENENGNP